MNVFGKHDQSISSSIEWERPLKEEQWSEGRSAMEIARAFFRDGQARLPGPLVALLRSVPQLADFVAEEARPEFRTDLPPTGSSGPRNHDVWVRGRVGGRPVCLGIEAKADEPFDGPLSAKQDYGDKRAAEGLASDMPQRLAALGAMLFGPSFNIEEPAYFKLGYQLLAGVAGTAVQAAKDGAGVAVFVVYEFSTAKTRPANQLKNAADLDAFVRLLPGAFPGVVPGQLLGPLRLEASASLPQAVDLFIGKVEDQP